MQTFASASQRTLIETFEGQELSNRKLKRLDPNAISVTEWHGLPGSGPLILDGLRERPRYFDGRFLTGADLTRDQDYVRQRQADLARASGTGVVAGLQVALNAEDDTLSIAPGYGITPSGSVVIIESRRKIALSDLPAIRQLDVHLGIRLEPAQPLTQRTGLFILALRPVEFTATPIASYPTTLTGPRGVADGDVIEATAITLIPYPETGGAGSLDEMRRSVARLIFLQGSTNGQPQDALGLAMLALDRGHVRWIDVDMVRRETGADTPLQVALGARPRALAEAHVLQYERHLAEVLESRKGVAFPAAETFAALPAAGRMPLAAITHDGLGFLQAYFPALVDVDVSFVASDEIAALVEESLALPPIDLMGDAADLDATGVLVLVPVKREALKKLEAAFSETTKKARTFDPLPGLRRLPLAMLSDLIARRPGRMLPVPATPGAEQDWKSAWETAIANMPEQRDGQPNLLWYVRRRTVAYRPRLEGTPAKLTGKTDEFPDWRDARLNELGFADQFNQQREMLTEPTRSRFTAFLGSPRILTTRALFAAAFLKLAETISDDQDANAAAVENTALEFSAPSLGAGFARLLTTTGKADFAPEISLRFANEGLVVEADQRLRELAPEKFAEIAPKIQDAIETGNLGAARELLSIN